MGTLEIPNERIQIIADSDELTRAVAQFSADFHKRALKNEGNYLAAPLGAWLLLAQLAGANREVLNEEDRFWAEQTLHLPLSKAFNLATRLLQSAPEDVKVAAAAWVDMTRGEVSKDWVWALKRTNAAQVSEIMPKQAELDRWANDHTEGMIKQFPLETSANVFFVLANAIATRIKWDKNFEVKQARNDWGVHTLLHEDNLHQTYLIDDDRSRTFAVHVARGNSIEVLSVIAENPLVPYRDVLKLAERLANHNIYPVHTPRAGSQLYDIRKRVGLNDTYEVWIPAWSAKSSIDLTKLDLHLDSAVKSALLKGGDINAMQSVYAKYSSEGFEAAAITTSAMLRSSAIAPTERDVLHYTVRFDHPYAVVARWEGYGREHSLWRGLPLFSGIVREAEEPK